MAWVICVYLPNRHGWYTGCRGISDAPILADTAGDALAYCGDGSAWADVRLARRAFPTGRFAVEEI